MMINNQLHNDGDVARDAEYLWVWKIEGDDKNRKPINVRRFFRSVFPESSLNQKNIDNLLAGGFESST